MTTSAPRLLARRACAVAAAGLLTLAGCAAVEQKAAAGGEPAAEAPAAAASVAARAVANFSDELRCMDYLLVDYGARDLTVSVDDLVDPTKKLNTAAKGMLASAVSDMTRRSRAIRSSPTAPSRRASSRSTRCAARSRRPTGWPRPSTSRCSRPRTRRWCRA
jgi:hypothetical protein